MQWVIVHPNGFRSLAYTSQSVAGQACRALCVQARDRRYRVVPDA